MSAGPLPSSCFHDALSCWILQAHVLCFSLSSRMPAGHGGLMLPPNGDSPQILVLPFTFRMIIHLELHFVLSCRSGKAHFSEYGRNRRISPPPHPAHLCSAVIKCPRAGRSLPECHSVPWASVPSSFQQQTSWKTNSHTQGSTPSRFFFLAV